MRPRAEEDLRVLRDHPAVVIKEMTLAEADAVEEMLARTRVFDVLAGHVVHVAPQRGRPVVTSDPARLHRLEPDVELNLV